MNAIQFLIKEHDHVRRILGEIEDDSHRDKTKRKMFDELCDDLLRHETMEHKVWYPHFNKNEKIDDTVRHLLSEEQHAEKAINQFKRIKNQAEWDEKFQQFKKDVEHHASEEEEKLFPKVKTILSEKELEMIGKKMWAFKREYAS